MKVKELANLIAKLEGKKSQISVGNAREIVGIISDILFEDLGSNNLLGTYTKLLENGCKRAKNKSQAHKAQSK